MVSQAADLLEERLERLPEQEVSMGQRARLRLMHLVMGNQREAVRPMDAVAPEFQEFWRNELLGLHTLLDENAIPDQSQRCALAQYHMQEAQASFEKTCPLEIRNMQLIEIPDHQVVGYGIYEPSRGEYLAGKKAYLYAELENVSTKSLSDGFFTKVGSRYEIIDANGNSVVKHDCNVCEDLCRSRRRDVYIWISIDLPATLYPGRYVVQLTITDMNHPNLQMDQERCELVISSPPSDDGP
jgi:hypothetical protein